MLIAKKTLQRELKIHFDNLSNKLKDQVYNSLNLFIPRDDLMELDLPFKRDRIYESFTLFWAFSTQCLRKSFSCADAVSFIMSHRLDMGLPMGSYNTVAYCKARAKLDIVTLKRISITTGKKISESYNKFYWKYRQVKIIDGTTFRMADSKQNKKEYPKPYRPKDGLGEPVIRMIGLFCFATGAFLDLELGKYKGIGEGEVSLLKKMIDRINDNDVLLMDRLYSSYDLMEALIYSGKDIVARTKENIAEKLIKEYKIKDGDGIVNIKNINDKDRQITLRLIWKQIQIKGHRPKKIYVFTSLNSTYSKEEIINLYQKRWDIELYFMSIKTLMGLNTINAKTPDMVQREIYTTLISYNLVRKVMCDAGMLAEIPPHKISFSKTSAIFISRLII